MANCSGPGGAAVITRRRRRDPVQCVFTSRSYFRAPPVLPTARCSRQLKPAAVIRRVSKKKAAEIVDNEERVPREYTIAGPACQKLENHLTAEKMVQHARTAQHRRGA